MDPALPDIMIHELDIERLESLLRTEFQDYCTEFDSSPLPARQELRAFLISWVAALLPEAAPKDFVSELEDKVSGLRQRADFRTEGWFKALPLDIALFAITGDYWWLKSPIWNINHHKSSLRELVLLSLAVVADRLDFHDAELQSRVAYNVEVGHMYADWSVLLLTVAQGHPEAKRRLFQDWLNRFGDNALASHARELLSKFLTGGLVENPFLSHLLQLHQYLCLRLLEKPRQPLSPTPSAEQPVQARLTLGPPEPSLGQKLWDCLGSRPLMQSHIQLQERGS